MSDPEFIIRRQILVHPSRERISPRLRSLLQDLLPVSFIDCPDTMMCQPLDFLIDIFNDQRTPTATLPCGMNSFHVAAHALSTDLREGISKVEFSKSSRLEATLRGRSLPHRKVATAGPLTLKSHDEVLATYMGIPAWVHREESGSHADFVSIPLPEWNDEARCCDRFYAEDFISLLPIIHFLRKATSGLGWNPPPLRACLMFDDPNLHWESYGFLHFGRVAEQARLHGFHTAIATVPLDAWCPSPKAVRLFRENARSFSLLFHGIDHTRGELGNINSFREALSLIAQGLHRIDRFENKTGLRVARIMVPPHEKYSFDSLKALQALGFLGACISVGSLFRQYQSEVWHSSFGFNLSEFMIGCFPILHRFNMNTSCEGETVLSAFLNRPIIPIGHHDTLASGLEIILRTVELVNRSGSVQWLSPEELFLSNFSTLRRNETLWIRPFSTRVRLQVPPGITKIGIYPPPEATDLNSWQMYSVASGSVIAAYPAYIPTNVPPGQHLEFAAERPAFPGDQSVPKRGFSSRALARRILCESRDRLAPFVA